MTPLFTVAASTIELLGGAEPLAARGAGPVADDAGDAFSRVRDR